MIDNNLADTSPETLPAAQEAIPGKAERSIGAEPFINCTGCGQCVEDCPLQLPIPELMDLYNKYLASGAAESLGGVYNSLTSDSRKTGVCACCRVCEGSCINHVKIADTVHKLSALFD